MNKAAVAIRKLGLSNPYQGQHNYGDGIIMVEAADEIDRLQKIVDLVIRHDSNLIDHLERHAKET